MMNHKIISALFAAAFGLTACVSTPQSRIEENPALFQALPAKEQALVTVGQIKEGMTPPAVFLAWGAPTAVAEGKLNGKQATRWIYSSMQPVYTTPPTPWAGPYWGPYWGPAHYRYFYPYYNDITYIPVDTGYVLFVNGKVKSWERRR